MYGGNWDASIPLAEVLVLWGVAQATYCYSIDALLAIGRVKVSLVVEMVSMSIKLAVVLIAARHGLATVAYGLGMVALVEFFARNVVLGSCIGYGARDLLFSTWRSGGVALLLAVVAHVMAGRLSAWGLPLFVQLVVAGMVAATVWLATVFLLRHPIANEVIRMWKGLKTAPTSDV